MLYFFLMIIFKSVATHCINHITGSGSEKEFRDLNLDQMTNS